MQYHDADTQRHKCRHCGYEARLVIVEMDHGPHYAKAICYSCEQFIDWVASPESKHREAGHKDLARKYGRGYCELCLVKAEDLPKAHELVAHHVVEYQSDPDNSRENIWVVCAPCHRLIHWRRNYATLTQMEFEPKE